MGKRTTFFTIDRAMLNHDIWINTEPFTFGQAWVDIIGNAAYETHTSLIHNKPVKVVRGSLPTSYRLLSVRWKWGIGKVQSFLEYLVGEGMISLKTTKSGTLIIVEKYSYYQGKTRSENTQTERKQNTDGTQTERKRNHITKDNKGNNGNNVCISAPRKNTHACGAFENVWLTDTEEAEIRETYERPQELIDKVSAWLTEHTRKNHYATILTFARNDKWPKRPVIHRAEPEPEKQEDCIPMPDDTKAIYDQWLKEAKVK